jgi:release factor glutamine methyltransferase
VREALRTATARIAAAGSDSARLDAELLMAHVLEVDRARLIVDRDRELSPDEAARYEALVARREAHEPVAYILGRKAFRRLEFVVDRRALVPRPLTEQLVEVAAEELPQGARVVDVGTGCGAIALALADERPDLDVIATDISEDALALARENASLLGLEVTFTRGDLLDGVEGHLDAVIMNPPYIPDAEQLPPDVADHEPGTALWGGIDGLGLIRRIVAAAVPRAPFLALEVGTWQPASVVALARAAGYETVEARRDLAGVERIVVARR